MHNAAGDGIVFERFVKNRGDFHEIGTRPGYEKDVHRLYSKRGQGGRTVFCLALSLQCAFAERAMILQLHVLLTELQVT